MDIKQQILNFLRKTGPSIPRDISREVKKDTIIVSSLLSELMGAGKVLITKVKFGSSSFYYLPEHKQKLEAISSNLNEKDLRAYNLLKDRRIIKNEEVDPLTRVSLQNIKDYSFPLKVTYQGNTLIFYRYFLVNQDEATNIIRERYFSQKKAEQKEQRPVQKKEPEQKQPERKEVEVKKEKPIVKETKTNDEKKPKQVTLSEVDETGVKPDDVDDELFAKVKKKLESLEIQIESVDVIRKNSEIDLIVKVPSKVGMMEFFGKVKKKKRINEGDLSSAYITGQGKKLPVLFITNGKSTKKALAMIDKDFKNNFTMLEF